MEPGIQHATEHQRLVQLPFFYKYSCSVARSDLNTDEVGYVDARENFI